MIFNGVGLGLSMEWGQGYPWSRVRVSVNHELGFWLYMDWS